MQKNEITRSMYLLRDYQQEAVSKALSWIRQNSLPALLELATGAGKSLICAEIARETIALQVAKFLPVVKKVLCLCPTAELVEQNYEKYLMTGNEASIYSASIGKSLKENVVFATEGTFKAVAEEQGDRFSLVIIDEAHKITPTIKKIIDDMRKENPMLRVIGMTGTPYRLGEGYIYEMDERGRTLLDTSVKKKKDDTRDYQTKNPYFKKLLYRVTTNYLISLGYLTPVEVGKIGASPYSAEGLSLGKGNSFNAKDVDQVFVGKGTKTSAIVADVVNQANLMGSRGVMFFAATVKHAEEIMASLPNYNSAIVTGETPKKERKAIIKAYKEQRIKYLVNVSVLTTGFDAPHTDVVAILRATESASLLEQIIGRGLRLFEGKLKCLLLDYAGNLEKFYPDGELFEPKIMAYDSKPNEKADFICETCGGTCTFSKRSPEDFGGEYKDSDWDEYGYYLNERGNRTNLKNQNDKNAKDIFIPAHYGRRCTVVREKGKNVFERCDGFWTSKLCKSCDCENDIAARRCSGCGEQLIDPNEKLSGAFEALKADPRQMQTDVVTNMLKKRPRRDRPDLIMVVFETPYRQFEAFFSNKVHRNLFNFVNSSDFNRNTIKTVTYKLLPDGKHYHIYDFNREEDRDENA